MWTNRQATNLREIPERAVVLGGGPAGVELGQMLARYGAQVTIVQHADRLVNREDPRVGELIHDVLRDDDGIDIRLRSNLRSVRADGAGIRIELDDGTDLAADVLVVGAGRTPRTGGLGLEKLEIRPTQRGLRVDERCAIGPGLWAVGDVTGTLLFTHVAMYQGRVVAANILGKQRHASYLGIPRVIFSDPEIAAVGMTEDHARAAGIDVAVARIGLADTLARPWTYERDPRGEFGVVADRARGVLVGAWAVAPLASEWIHHAALAVRNQIPLTVLADGIAQYPTSSESLVAAVESLETHR